MLSVQRTTGGVILLDLRGIANATYVLQYCEDLSAPNWTDLATGTADNQGRWQTTDDTASQTAHRFYRARLVTVGAINLYVDSAGGDDANSGATVPTALRTLAAARSAALTHGTGVKIGLLSGSHWRESLDLSSVTNATVQAVGTGPAPVIDGADVVAAWTKTTGRTNVYQATITHDATASNRLTVYEDGAMLSRVADQATCDSTPGSFVDAKGSDGSPLTIYLRPAAAGSPATNGHLYEVTTRYAALLLGQGASVAGVQTQRQIDNNGSLDAVNVPGVTISRILALDGTKHNLGIGSGTVSDCITARNDPPTSYEVSNTAFVAFLNDGTGQNALFERCGAILCARGTVDFLTHGGVPLAAVTTRQCWTVGASFGSQVGTTVGNYYQAVLIAPTTSGTLSQTLVRLRADGGVSTVATYGATSISDSVFLAEERVGAATPNYAEMFRLQGATTLAHCAFGGLTGNTNWFANDNSSAALTMNYCVFDGGVNHISTGGGGTYAGDHNVFRPTNVYNPAAQIECATPAGYKETLAAWQAYSGQDAHSVYLSSTDQSAGSANAFWLGVKNAATGTDLSTVGPAAGDWRVNPAARVYGADGTAYAGTFPDGTAITQAGPQTRWDWNARASAAGAPAAWPNVPATVADAQAYVLHPDAWVF